MDFNLLCTLLFVVLLLAVGSINCGSDDDQSVISTNESGTAGERIDPEITMDFKVIINPYDQECYYISLKSRDIFHFIINILKGGDTKVDILISEPFGGKLYDKKDQTFAWYDNANITKDGVHSVCLNNRDSHEKLAYINFISFPKGHQESKELEHQQLNETSTFMMDTLHKIAYNLFSASRAQTYQRIMSSKDSYTLETNMDYVQQFSILQIAIIIISGMIQTYFIKKLFEMKSHTSKY